MWLYNLSRLPAPYRLHGREIRFEASILKEVIRIGVPAGCQSLVITLSNVIAQYFINSFGEDSIAAFTAYFKVELIIYLPIVAFGQSIMAFSGQCKGAEDYSRIRKGTEICLALSMLVAGLTSAAALRGGAVLFRIFNKEAAVIEAGLSIIRTLLLWVLVPCTGSLQGVAVTYPITWALTAVCMMGYYVIYHRNAERSVRFGLKETETFIE